MAIAVEIQLADGLSRRDYEVVLDGLALEEHPPEGLVVHVATESGRRIKILEVWESARQYHRFRDERLLPNIEYALGHRKASLTAESIRSELPVRGMILREPIAA